MKLALTQGAYEARSIIADAQRSVNLYPEQNPEDSPYPFTHYPTPGLVEFADPATGVVRGMYRATNGELFAVVANTLYYVTSIGVPFALGTIANNTTPVSMCDTGVVLVLVDGTANGYAIRLSDHAFGAIQTMAGADTVFYGSDYVQYADTFFIFNRPGTQQFYLSVSNVTYELLTGGGSIQSGTITNPGTQYYGPQSLVQSIALTGGSGTGAVADLTFNKSTAEVQSLSIINAGAGYLVGDVLGANYFQTVSVTLGAGGAGYTNGVYANVLFGGNHGGSVRLASVTVAGGAITVISASGITNNPVFSVGDTLSDVTGALGAGAGLIINVSAVAYSSGGLQYRVDSVATAAFDPLDIASKTGYADKLVAAIVMHREIWLIGQLSTEVWYNTGATDFTYGIMPGVFIQHGCVAKYSIAQQDLSIFWLSQDLQGQALVVMGNSYSAKRVSTHAIESTIQAYETVSDAIGYTYQQGGHVFYVLTFPTANATWVYDVATNLWHQRASTDNDGNLNRHRSNCAAFAYGLNLVGDYSNGKIYSYDQTVFTDDGNPISRIRSFPHVQSEDKRVMYRNFVADMEVGNAAGTTTDQSPQISLRWSDDRGRSYGNAVEQDLGSAGQYLTSVQWNRLGMARDRVFELSWSANVKTSLNGAYIEVQRAGT